jgi:hypothetical protein
MDFRLKGHKYVGGASYQVIAASPKEILAALSDANQLPLALPLTHDATELPLSAPSSVNVNSFFMTPASPQNVTVELTQGNALFKARYTLELRRLDAHTLGFSLDSSRKHDIRDARGYFTAHQISPTHSLVSVFVGVDLGGGLAKALLRRPVQKAALSSPAHIRAYVEPIAQRQRIARAAALARTKSRSRSTVADRR